MTPDQQKHLRVALAKVFEGRMELESLRDEIKLEDTDEAADLTATLDDSIDSIERGEDDLEAFKGGDAP